MSWVAISMVTMIWLGVVTSFTVLVWYGPSRAPMWLIYASYPISALAGGAAINMILFGVPK
jgi:hypothetical protein